MLEANNDEVMAYLLAETEHEIKQKESGLFSPDYPNIVSNMYTNVPILPNHLFFQNKDIYISKHNRYASYPIHSHQFLELNYVYSGTSKQVINEESHLLEQGDILLMDVGSRHSIKRMGKEDILINILFQDTQISIDWLNQLQNANSIFYQILLNKPKHINNHHNYLILPTKGNPHIQQIINQMLKEYFIPNNFSEKIISTYLPILFYELARNLPTINMTNQDYSEDQPLIKVLQLIDRDFSSLTLQDAARSLNFNKNYLSNMIKEKSGYTFTELINKKRLMEAKILIQSTKLPISDIALKVGYSNKNYFYTHYFNQFGHKPSYDRN